MAGNASEPEVFRKVAGEEIELLVLGTDGMWDALRGQIALSHARRHSGPRRKPQGVAVAVRQSTGKVSMVTTLP